MGEPGAEGGTEQRGSRRHSWRWALLLFFVAIGVYAPALRAGFVWDDRAAFTAGLGELRTLGDFFSPPKSEGRDEYAGRHFYPLTELTLKIDQTLGSIGVGASVAPLAPRRAHVPHATSLLFHGIATLLVALFVRGLLDGLAHRDAGAFAAALLFAVHPIHTESVCFIVGRTDVLATIFVLASILLAWRYRDGAGVWAAVASALAFGLGLLSKELAATEILLLPTLYRVGSRPREESEAARRGGGELLAGLFAAVLIGYVILRAAPGAPARLGLAAEPAELPMRMLAALAFYVGKVLAPIHANPYPMQLPGVPQTALVLCLAGLGLGAAVVLHRRGDRIPLLAIFFFLVTVAPAILVALSAGISRTPLAERYLYLPSVGLAMVVGDAVARLLESQRWRKPVTAGVALLAVAGAGTSLSRTRIWQRDVHFWQYVLQDPAAAGQAAPWFNLGAAYEVEGHIDRAREAFRRARQEGGAQGHDVGVMAESVFADAIAAFRRRDFAAAETAAARAETMLEQVHAGDGAASVPDDALARYGFLRAQAHLRATGEVDRATLERVLGHVKAVLRRDPSNAVARRLLGPTRRALARESAPEPRRSAPLSR